MGETGIGRQIDEEEKKPNSEIGWDGHKRTGVISLKKKQENLYERESFKT